MKDYSKILDFISKELGLNIDSIGLLSLARGINNSMSALNIQNIDEFEKSIQSDKHTLNNFIENIKVPETWFFRDIECYSFLKQHIKSNRNNINSLNPLKILSAPCSTGEEPYSILMLAYDLGLREDEIMITAVDISAESLKIAKDGIFRSSSFRNDFDGFENKYFDYIDGNYKIKDILRNKINFINKNIVSNKFLDNLLNFDLIFCKNLLIYLNDDARITVLNNINKLLKEDGILLVGLSEINFFTRNGFEQIKHNMAFACRKQKFKAEIYQPSKFKSEVTVPSQKPKSNRVFTGAKPSENIFNIRSENSFIETINIVNVKKLADEGKFDEAEKMCNTILITESYNTEALYYLGLIHHSTGKNDIALNYFTKVLFLEPDNYESLIHVSLIYDSMGNANQSEIFRKRAEKSYFKKLNPKE